MLADYHMHTEFSDDSEELMEDVVEQAIQLGFDEICFTDHVDYGIKVDRDVFAALSKEEQQKIGLNLNVDYPSYAKKLQQLRAEYQDKITIKFGMEFGVQTQWIPQYEALFQKYPLDFVIMSCHQAEDKEFWNYEFQQGKTLAEANDRYYQEIYDCVRCYKNYSVLGHLDMMQRYNKPRYPFSESKDLIEKILEIVIADKKGIEVNTSSFRYGLPEFTPEREILKLYHEMGGEIITLGSDCHKLADVGEYISYMKEELKKIGYKYACTFDRMVPSFYEL